MEPLGGRAVLPEIPRLLLMRWDGIEFWKPTLCERDLRSLTHVRNAIDDLKQAVARRPTDTAADLAARCDACQAAYDRLSHVSRRVGNDLRTPCADKSPNQLWRARHIAHLLDGVEDESVAASVEAAQCRSRYKAAKEGHPSSPPDARNLVAPERCRLSGRDRGGTG